MMIKQQIGNCTSIPLIREMAIACGFIFPFILHKPSTNWWGATNTGMIASLTVIEDQPGATETEEQLS